MEFTITKENLYDWCSIPMEELANHPKRKCDILIRQDKARLYREIGDMMTDELIQHNRQGIPTKWILPAGHLDHFKVFIHRVNTERISCKNLHIFHMDEWLDWQFRPLPVGDNFHSARGLMQANFYDPIDPELTIPEENRYWPDVNDPDAMDEAIQRLGGVDTVQAGVGCKGMIAFDEPPRSAYHRISLEEYAASKTRITTINDDTIVAYAQREFGGCYDAVPPNGVTIGMKSILTAKKAICIVTTGEWKQTVIRVAMFSEATTEYPVTLLANRLPHCLLCCDDKTADHVISHMDDRAGL